MEISKKPIYRIQVFDDRGIKSVSRIIAVYGINGVKPPTHDELIELIKSTLNTEKRAVLKR